MAVPGFIDEQIQSLAVPIDSIFPDPVNARDHPEESIIGIAASLREFGQTKPIVVRKETMVICAGNGTWLAAKRLGWTHIAANLRDMDALTATKLALIDNRTAELSSWKQEVVDQLMPELTFEDPELQAMMNKLNDELKTLDAEAPNTSTLGGGDDFDATPSEEGETRTKVGDIWLIDPYFECEKCKKVYDYQTGLTLGDCTCE